MVDELKLTIGSSRALDGHAAVIDLELMERLHELVVRAVAQRLVFVLDGGGVLGRIGGALVREPTCNELRVGNVFEPIGSITRS